MADLLPGLLQYPPGPELNARLPSWWHGALPGVQGLTRYTEFPSRFRGATLSEELDYLSVGHEYHHRQIPGLFASRVNFS